MLSGLRRRRDGSIRRGDSILGLSRDFAIALMLILRSGDRRGTFDCEIRIQTYDTWRLVPCKKPQCIFILINEGNLVGDCVSSDQKEDRKM